MPLEKGSSKETIAKNIREMEEHGHPHEQAVAAALHTAHPGGAKDNMLSWGGGYPLSTPTGPGDKPFSTEVATANSVADRGEYAKAASKFLGKNALDGIKELEKEGK